jgi:RimJ/RimL family protein N-acetyltransferase
MTAPSPSPERGDSQPPGSSLSHGSDTRETEPGVERDTARLSLRRPRLMDLDAMFAIHADPETARHSPTGPITPTREAAKDLLLTWLIDWTRHGFGYWTVRLLDTEQVIGFGGVTFRRLAEFGDEPIANLYYRYQPSAWGNGYATEMAREAVALVRERAPRSRLVALVRPSNVASARVAERVGMSHTFTVSRDNVAMCVYELRDSVARS